MEKHWRMLSMQVTTWMGSQESLVLCHNLYIFELCKLFPGQNKFLKSYFLKLISYMFKMYCDGIHPLITLSYPFQLRFF